MYISFQLHQTDQVPDPKEMGPPGYTKTQTRRSSPQPACLMELEHDSSAGKAWGFASASANPTKWVVHCIDATVISPQSLYRGLPSAERVARDYIWHFMRAVVVKRPGPPDVLELVHDYPVPKLRDGEVLSSAS